MDLENHQRKNLLAAIALEGTQIKRHTIRSITQSQDMASIKTSRGDMVMQAIPKPLINANDFSPIEVNPWVFVESKTHKEIYHDEELPIGQKIVIYYTKYKFTKEGTEHIFDWYLAEITRSKKITWNSWKHKIKLVA